jgi:hypothetical protein
MFTATRLHLGAYYFFSSRSNMNLSGLIEVYCLACSFVEFIQARDRQDNYALYLSEQYYRTLLLAAITILRECRSPELKSTIDCRLGEQAYFAAIQILKKRVLKNNDLNAQMATILSQLWQSQRVFRQQDGSYDSLNVRVRSRGVRRKSFQLFLFLKVRESQDLANINLVYFTFIGNGRSL